MGGVRCVCFRPDIYLVVARHVQMLEGNVEILIRFLIKVAMYCLKGFPMRKILSTMKVPSP